MVLGEYLLRRQCKQQKIRSKQCLKRILQVNFLYYPKNVISTPAATAEPITPDTLLDIQY